MFKHNSSTYQVQWIQSELCVYYTHSLYIYVCHFMWEDVYIDCMIDMSRDWLGTRHDWLSLYPTIFPLRLCYWFSHSNLYCRDKGNTNRSPCSLHLAIVWAMRENIKDVIMEKWLWHTANNMAYCQQLLDKWGTCTYLSYSITACLYFNICGSQVPLRLSQTFMQAFTS